LSEEFPAAARWGLAVLVGVQAFLLAKALVSPYLWNLEQHLELSRQALSPKHVTHNLEAAAAVHNRNELVDLIVCSISTALALASLILGYWYTGSGEGVDVDLAATLRRYSTFALAAGAAQMALWTVAIAFPYIATAYRKKKCWPDQRLSDMEHPERWVDLLLYRSVLFALYGHNTALATAVALVPHAGLTMVCFLGVALITLVFALPVLLYHGIVAVVIGLGRRGRSGTTQASALLGGLLLGLWACHTYFAYAYLLQPLISCWDVSYTPSQERGLAFFLVAAAAVAVQLLVLRSLWGWRPGRGDSVKKLV